MHCESHSESRSQNAPPWGAAMRKIFHGIEEVEIILFRMCVWCHVSQKEFYRRLLLHSHNCFWYTYFLNLYATLEDKHSLKTMLTSLVQNEKWNYKLYGLLVGRSTCITGLLAVFFAPHIWPLILPKIKILTKKPFSSWETLNLRSFQGSQMELVKTIKTI